MKFAHPEYLYLLILNVGILIWNFFIFSRRKRIINSIFSIKNLKKTGIVRDKFKFGIKTLLIMIVYSLIILALASPQYGYRLVKLSKSKKKIFIAIDVSRSMNAQDEPPNRLEFAKRKIIEFIKLLHGERVGLISFAGISFINIPLTVDYSIFYDYLKIINTDLIPVQGTNFYNLLNKVINLEKKENLGSLSLLILSDGENFSKSINVLLKECKKYGIRIFAIGIGKLKPVPIKLPNGEYKKDKNGNIVLTSLHENFLENLCLSTNGVYVRATPTFEDVKIIYRKISEVNGGFKSSKNYKKVYINRYQWFLFPAFILLCIYFLIDERRKFPIILLFILVQTNLHAFNCYFYNKKGIKFYKEKKYEKSLKYFKKAYKNSKKEEFLYNQGLALYKLRNYNSAENVFNKIYEKSKKLKEKSIYNIGVIKYREKKYKEALKAFKEALKLNPNDMDARIDYELTLKKLKNKNKKKGKKVKKNNKNGESRKNNEEFSTILNLYSENPNYLKKMLKRRLKYKNINPEKDW